MCMEIINWNAVDLLILCAFRSTCSDVGHVTGNVTTAYPADLRFDRLLLASAVDYRHLSCPLR